MTHLAFDTMSQKCSLLRCAPLYHILTQTDLNIQGIWSLRNNLYNAADNLGSFCFRNLRKKIIAVFEKSHDIIEVSLL